MRAAGADRRSCIGAALLAVALAVLSCAAEESSNGASETRESQSESPAGHLATTLAFSTYLGGAGGFGDLREVAVDSRGDIVITGHGPEFNRSNFPTATVFGPARGQNVLVAKLDPEGHPRWVTIIGGSGKDRGYGLDLDPAGDIYVAGRTSSPDFPTTEGAFDQSYNGGTNARSHPHGPSDAYALKLAADGQRLLYSTYLGGSGEDGARGGVAVDDRGFAYVVGFTRSRDFLDDDLANPAEIGTVPRDSRGFVTKLSRDGSRIVYSRRDVGGVGVEVDGLGHVYLHAMANSATAFTTPDAYDRTFNGRSDVYFLKISPDGKDILYATYLGGTGDEFAEHRIAIDASGNAYLVGHTRSKDFPVVNAQQPQPGGGVGDGYLVKLDPAGQPVFSTYVGGSGRDNLLGPAVDRDGNIFVTGWTESDDFPTTPEAHDASHGGGTFDALLLVYSPTGRLLSSTFLGGAGYDRGRYVALDHLGNPIVVGETGSRDFPTTPGAHDRIHSGDEKDGFVTRFEISPGRASREPPTGP